MRRTLISIAYAIAGLALAVGLTAGGYAIAGRDLSEPVRVIRPAQTEAGSGVVAPPQATASPEDSPSPEDSASPDDKGGDSSGSDDDNSGSGSSNSGSGSSNSGSGSSNSGSGSGDDPDDD